MELHQYDGVNRRFRHTDSDRETGLAIVAQLLYLPIPPSDDGVLYELSFSSGGMGILDTLAITLPADRTLWANLITAVGAKTPEDAITDLGWADDLVWLLSNEQEPLALREAAVQFINRTRCTFQAVCDTTHRILFADGSNVNTWSVLWGDDTRLNYCGYDQG